MTNINISMENHRGKLKSTQNEKLRAPYIRDSSDQKVEKVEAAPQMVFT